jgi:hypothetical protein
MPRNKFPAVGDREALVGLPSQSRQSEGLGWQSRQLQESGVENKKRDSCVLYCMRAKSLRGDWSPMDSLQHEWLALMELEQLQAKAKVN